MCFVFDKVSLCERCLSKCLSERCVVFDKVSLSKCLCERCVVFDEVFVEVFVEMFVEAFYGKVFIVCPPLRGGIQKIEIFI